MPVFFSFSPSSPASRQFSAMLAAAASTVSKPQVVTKTLTEYVGPRVASIEQAEEAPRSKKAESSSKWAPDPTPAPVAADAVAHSSTMLPGMPIAQQALGNILISAFTP